MAHDSSRDAVKVGRPATSAAEFVRGLVQGGLTASTGVDAFRRVVLVVCARSRRLSTLFTKDSELL